MLQKTADWRSFRTSASNCCEYGELGPSMVARMLPGSIMRYNNTKENDEHQCRRNCFDTTATTKAFIAAYAGGLCREGSKVLQASIAESHSVPLGQRRCRLGVHDHVLSTATTFDRQEPKDPAMHREGTEASAQNGSEGDGMV